MFSQLSSLDLGSLSDYMARFALALAVGIIVGSERERSTPDRGAPGVRTFAILSLIGAACVLFGPTVLAAGLLAAFGIAISPSLKQRTEDQDPPGYGATTIAAAVTAPLLGALAVFMPALSAATAVALAVTLASKDRIHSFIRKTVTPTELNDAFKFSIVALIVLPLLPDKTFGPYGIINLHRIGFLVTALTGIGWLGYIAVRTFGASRGLPLAGFAGGFISSTATTAAMARKGKDQGMRRAAVAAALLSKVSNLFTLLIIVAAISIDTLKLLAIPVGLMAIVLLYTSRAFAMWRRDHGNVSESEQGEESEPLDLGRPFTLKPALLLATFITAAISLSKIAGALLGSGAVILITAITGTANTSASVISAADLARDGSISPMAAMLGIIAGLLMNLVLKIVLAFSSGGREIGALIARGLIPAGIVLAVSTVPVALFLG